MSAYLASLAEVNSGDTDTGNFGHCFESSRDVYPVRVRVIASDVIVIASDVGALSLDQPGDDGLEDLDRHLRIFVENGGELS